MKNNDKNRKKDELEYMKRNENKGFSLLELIIVIAIMAILVGVMTPVLIGQIEKARTSKCVMDRDSLRTQINVDVLNGEYADAKAAFDALSDELKNDTCKSGGEYTFQWTNQDVGTYQIICSEHDKDKETPMTMGNQMETIKGILASYSGQLDSNAVNVSDSCNTAKALKELQNAGIVMGNLDATTWKYTTANGQKFFYWTPQDINEMNVGDTIPVYRYNITTGTYTIWYSKIETGTTGTGNGATYNTLGSVNSCTEYKESTSQAASEQTFENAQEMYDKAVNGN